MTASLLLCAVLPSSPSDETAPRLAAELGAGTKAHLLEGDLQLTPAAQVRSEFQPGWLVAGTFAGAALGTGSGALVALRLSNWQSTTPIGVGALMGLATGALTGYLAGSGHGLAQGLIIAAAIVALVVGGVCLVEGGLGSLAGAGG